jgi:hypothetical protein
VSQPPPPGGGYPPPFPPSQPPAPHPGQQPPPSPAPFPPAGRQPPPGQPWVPQPAFAGGPHPAGAPQFGYGFVPAAARPTVRKSSHVKLFVLLVAGLVAAAAVFIGITRGVETQPEVAKPCPPVCPPPPVGKPVTAETVFTGPNGSFSFEYPNISGVQKSTSGIAVQTTFGVLAMQGGSANGQSPEEVATSFLRAKLPDARRTYVVPNAFVGYTHGYGEVDDVYLQSSTGTAQHERVVVLTAVKNDVQVTVVALGPYEKWTQTGLNDGHPSGVGMRLAAMIDQYVNSVRWKGETR